MNIELLSIDQSKYCSKQCAFCYNHSTREGNVMWKAAEVIDFCSDCITHGVKAVSLGGGEPFEYEGIFEVIDALYPRCYLSVTTNGLPLEDEGIWNLLNQYHPDKRVNSCSYAPGKQPLASLTFEGLIEALDRVKWRSCGTNNDIS